MLIYQTVKKGGIFKMEHIVRPIEKSELNRIIAAGEDTMMTEYLSYNYFGDYALLAFLLDKDGRKIIPGGEVEELRYLMRKRLSKIEQTDTTYRNYKPYYIKQDDMIEYSGGNKYAPDNFILKEGFSTLDIAIRIVTIFDRRQLSTVLPPEVVNLLLTLLPEEEIAKEYVKQ